MHFVVSWDIKASGQEWASLNDKMKEKIKSYSWARPLTTLYIVDVAGQNIWDQILKDLAQVCEANPNKINFIMSPLMSGGRYNGLLPGNLWEEINQRSK